MAETDPPRPDGPGYREAFRSTANPALLADTEFRIRDVNQETLSFLGYSYDELVGQPATILTNDEDQYAEMIAALTNDEAWEGEFTVRTKDDAVVIGRGSTAPVHVDGEKRGYVGVFLDTTKQRQYENVSKVLGRLLRHDLRNDLNVLSGRIDRATDRIDDEAALEDLAIAEDIVERTLNKSEKARDLRELLEESHELSNRPVRLDRVLADRVADISEAFEDAEVRYDPVPELRVVGDDLLSPALESILENAVVHNDKTTPVVEVGVEDRPSEVVVSVADNGPGVPDDRKDLIFGREERNPLHHGRGLSLFFTDQVVDSYGGDVWVEDNQPEGAVFKLRLDRVA